MIDKYLEYYKHCFAHLYGFTTEDLRYILDPEEVCGPGY